MRRENFITEHLASGILDTDKRLLYGVINTDNYDVMGYVFVAGDTPDCLEDVGCMGEDVERADRMGVGDTLYADWITDRAIIIVKLRDTRTGGE